jgi:alpha-N-arabinofuranosidase
MKRHFLSMVCGALLLTTGLLAQQPVTLNLKSDAEQRVIPREIYGQFAEHLGRCIYDGIWVGPNSKIPNINGYRKDIVDALKALNIPVLRWPGGCFADTYHWKTGVGPVNERPKIKNVFWGGTIDDNSFGTHEFFNLCELLGCEPYLSANVGSGTVQEMTEWIEYITSNEDTPMANLRRKNGREDAWKLKFIGVGNESWGCGGNMTPETYANLFRQYSGYCQLYGGEKTYRIASGANDWNTNWTEVLIKNAGSLMEGLSLHYYVVPGTWEKKTAATGFGEDIYFVSMKKALDMEEILNKQCAVMDKYDEKKRVGLLVDEWGIWTECEPGTNPGHLFQQNTMRDALIASVTLDIFNHRTDRVKMANIAQVINVLQAMILTKDDKMVLTPTYHVFEMYKEHQNAQNIPLFFVSPKYVYNEQVLDAISCTLSKGQNGKYHLTISNIDAKNAQSVELPLAALKLKGNISNARVLTCKSFGDHNTFENPNAVKPVEFKGASAKQGVVKLQLPQLSIVSIDLE